MLMIRTSEWPAPDGTPRAERSSMHAKSADERRVRTRRTLLVSHRFQSAAAPGPPRKVEKAIVMSTSSVRGSSARSLIWGSAAALAGMAAVAQQNALNAERKFPPKGTFLNVHSIRLHMIDTGGPGPAVILLHGNGVTLADMEISGLISRAAHRHRVVAFDRPGFGYSYRPRTTIWTPAAQANLLSAAFEMMGIEEAVVVGHSWGCMVALALALNHPRLVTGLVLVAGYYFPTPRIDVPLFAPPAIPVIGDVVRYTIAPLVGQLIKNKVIRKLFSPQRVPSRFSADFPTELSLRPGQIRAASEETGLMVSSAAAAAGRYKELQMPITIMAGTADEVADPRRQSLRLHDTINHSRLLLLLSQKVAADGEENHLFGKIHGSAVGRLGMGLPRSNDVEARFSAYVEGLTSVIGHADRVKPFRDYCLGLIMPGERKSVEPMAAITAPERTAAQHQSLLHFIGEGRWSDEEVLAKVRELVLPEL
jgi:pimeloyl-ACP methyl ester carboxylesterase